MTPAAMPAGDNLPDCPYVGITSYAERDAEFFFGRETEIGLVIANLKGSRLTLLYGESGVGKSSILLAGVMRRLHAEVAANLEKRASETAEVDDEPRKLPLAIALFNGSWVDPPLPALMNAIHAAVEEALGEHVPPWRPGEDVVQVLRTWTTLVRTILVVLDQFEEYFLYHPAEDGPDTVAGALPAVVNEPNLRINFLLSIREDALAKLDRFKDRIPVYGNVLRINYLDEDAARDAIEKPLERYNQLAGNGDDPYRAEPALVDEVLKQVKTGHAPLTSAGLAEDRDGANGKEVDTPVLQLVLTRLWEEERNLDSHVLRLGTFRDRLHGADMIVRRQLDRTMAALSDGERDAAARSFKFLVTPSGSKFAQSVTDLAGYAQVSRADVEPVLEKLAAGRILRPLPPPPGQKETRYEVFHDALGPTVLDWSTRHLEARASEEARREAAEQTKKARRRARIWAGVGLGSLAAAVGVAILAVYMVRERHIADSHRQAARARALLGVDPQQAVDAALDGVEVRATDDAVRALREAMSQSRLRFVHESDEEIRAAGFNSQGSRAVIAAEDATVRLWDVESGRLVSKYAGHSDAIQSATFSPSEPLVLTASYDGTARLWVAETGAQRAVLEQADSGELFGAAFSTRGDWVITLGWKEAYLWRRPARGWRDRSRATHVLAGHTDAIYAASFTRDGKRVVTASEDKTARIWDVASGGLLGSLRGNHERGVFDAAFSPDGSRIATVSGKTLHVWGAATGAEMYRVAASTDWVESVEFRPDGQLILTAGTEGVARAWDSATGRLLFELRGHTDRIAAAAFANGGRTIVTASSDGTMRKWDARTGRELRGHADWVHGATFSPDGRSVFTVSADHTLAKWDARSGRPLWRVHDRGRETLNDVAVDSTGRFVASVGDDSTGVIWSTSTGEELALIGPNGSAEIPVHDQAVLAVEFDPRGGRNRLATGAFDGRAIIWGWNEGDAEARPLRELNANLDPDEVLTHRDAVFGVAYSRDGTRLVTTGFDKTARVWNPDTGALISTFEGHRGKVGAGDFHPSGELVATASEDWTVRVWRARDGVEVKVLGGDGGPLRAVAFGADGRSIAAAGSGGYTYVWEWPSGKVLGAMKMHADLVNSIAFGKDGRLLTAGDDRTARIYRCESCGPLDELKERARRQVARIG